MTQAALSALTGMNAEFLHELYSLYLADPASVDPSWQEVFTDLGDEVGELLAEKQGASWAHTGGNRIIVSDSGEQARQHVSVNPRAIEDSLRALMLIRAYRVRGHLLARLDPLGLENPGYHPELDPKNYGFGASDFDRPIYLGLVLGRQTATMREIMGLLQSTYCGKIGIEFMHIQDPEQKSWLQERFEASANRTPYSTAERKLILSDLIRAEGFERFLQTKYTGSKRFGLEGGESTIAAIEAMLRRAVDLGVREVVVGMAHRGRLNMLTNVLGKSYVAIFSEFQGSSAYPDSVQGSGDVKYHLGTSTDRNINDKTLHVTMNPNPSHLEAVNPLVVGRVRAKQQQQAGAGNMPEEAQDKVMGLLLHGDAAFAGQGLVAETLALSELKGYASGGTVHVVINNQIGFTTNPRNSRFGPYCTDVAKMIQAPIFHVNGDDPEAVVHCASLAIDYRQRFNKDIVLDIYCYRRHGHNESDEPAFTQPIMYRTIKAQTSTRELYAQQLIASNVLSVDEAQSMWDEFMQRLEDDHKVATSYKPNKANWLEGRWQGLTAVHGDVGNGETGVELATLKKLGEGLTTVPDGFDINSKIARQLEQKKEMFKSGQGFDWATAEALAFGSLVCEGVPVRLSGQDCGRGTFSQRHAVLYDQTSENKYLPLNHLQEGQSRFEVLDSPLSEAAVLGFEYGYSLAEPHALVLWEAQFGDFANGAQVMIDQFICSSESKWLRMSGLVMLLPHGYEGQGPEHSSARLERFLQNSAEDNWIVANCTTPANYFHILRRQMKRNFRKPLILMTPKSLLRHKLCVSALADFGPKTSFQRVIGDDSVAAGKAKRVVLCSGKVYYDLLEARMQQKIKDVALIRVEQLYPFAETELVAELKKYNKATVVWCQEEPRNMGSWHFIDRRLEETMHKAGIKARPIYAGREDAASPATGSLKRHNTEQAALVAAALGV